MAIITCLSPIIVAYFGYMSSKQQKQTKEFIELQTKYNTMNEANKKKELEDQKNAIAGIQQSVKDLQNQMNDLKKSINIDDINIINKWKKNYEDGKHPMYKKMIDVWTIRDPMKRKIASENKLNYKEFYSINELNLWLKQYK